MMLLQGLDVVLVKTRFPENIGMAARACVNMGCSSLRLVDPERWDKEKAIPLATPKGIPLLDSLSVHPSVQEAVAPCALVLGTTARVGGWRRALLSPPQAGRLVAASLARGERVALVFGPEDRGLNNAEISHCQQLVTIPTDPAARSLNLAQAVLLLTYECANAVRALRHAGAPPPLPQAKTPRLPRRMPLSRPRKAGLQTPCPAAGRPQPPNRSASWLHSRICFCAWTICTGTIRTTSCCPGAGCSVGPGCGGTNTTPSWDSAVRSAPSWADPGISAHGNASFHSSFLSVCKRFLRLRP